MLRFLPTTDTWVPVPLCLWFDKIVSNMSNMTAKLLSKNLTIINNDFKTNFKIMTQQGQSNFFIVSVKTVKIIYRSKFFFFFLQCF